MAERWPYAKRVRCWYQGCGKMAAMNETVCPYHLSVALEAERAAWAAERAALVARAEAAERYIEAMNQRSTYDLIRRQDREVNAKLAAAEAGRAEALEDIMRRAIGIGALSNPRQIVEDARSLSRLAEAALATPDAPAAADARAGGE